MSSKVIIEDSALKILKGAVFSGTKYIDGTSEVSVGEYANARVSKADTIIPENIKKDVTILGVEGSYDGGSAGSLKFDTVAYTYDEVVSYLEEHKLYKKIVPYDYTFFYITNISKGLEENQYYVVTQCHHNWNIGEVIPRDDNYVFIQNPEEMVLDYNDREIIYDLYHYYDDNEQKHFVDFINLYIIEMIDDDNCKIVDKGSSKLNALYPLYLRMYEGDCESIQLLNTNDQIIATYDRIPEKGFDIEDTLYNNNYRMKAIPKSTKDICWGIYDLDAGFSRPRVDYQYPKIFKPEEVEGEIFIADKESVRILAKAGLPFICQSYYKITENRVLCDERLGLTTYAKIASGRIVFEIHNSFTSETHVIDAEYVDKEDEKYWFAYIEHHETEEILQGDNDTIITITCKNVPYKTSTYIHDDSSQVDFILTDGDGNEIPRGSTLEEGDEYQIRATDGKLPKYAAIYINDNLYRKLDYETDFVYLDLTDEYISDNDETVIRVDLELPSLATISLNNMSSSALEIQKKFDEMGMTAWSTIKGGYCSPLKSIDVQVEATDENLYRIRSTGASIDVILNNGSIYHGDVKQESSMDLADLGSMTYILVNDDLPISEDGFYLTQDDNISFNIVDKPKDFITIDNTNGTSVVQIQGYWNDSPYTVTQVMPGSTYNLTSQTFMGSIVIEFSLMSDSNATWLEEGSEEPITLQKDANLILDPNGNSKWTVLDSYDNGHLGTITLGSTQPSKDLVRRIGVSDDSDKSQELYLVFSDKVIYTEGIPKEFEWRHNEVEKSIHIIIKPGQTINLVELDHNLFGAYYVPDFEIRLYTTDPKNFTIYGTGNVVIPSQSYSKTYDNEQIETKPMIWDREGGKNRYMIDTGLHVVKKSPKDSNDVLDMVFNLSAQEPVNNL